MACPDCGSWSVKSDRGLSGRMVCGRCGRPLGGGAAQRRRWPGIGGLRRRRGPAGRPSLALSLLLLLAAGALLTALSDQLGPTRQPTRQLWPSPDSTDPEAKRGAIMIRNIAS